MTKEEFLAKWGYTFSSGFIKDLDNVISQEIAKSQELSTNESKSQPKVTPTEQPQPKFDRDRFERMFCAVVANGGHELCHKEAIELTEQALAELDAYYAKKEGGNNG